MGRSPTGLQSQTVQGLICQMPVLEVGVPGVGYKHIAFQGEAPGFEFPLTVAYSSRRGVHSEIVSQSFPLTLVWFPAYLVM